MKDDQRPGHLTISVVVHAPNNTPHTFSVDVHERMDKLAREAVAYFVTAGQMQNDACGLALVHDGVAVPLDDTSRLEEDRVQDGAVLKLVVKKPKTDGGLA